MKRLEISIAIEYILACVSIDQNKHQLHFSLQIGNLPQEAVYLSNLRRQHSYCSLSSEMAFAIAGCNDSGQLTKSFCVIQKLMFRSKTSVEKQIILLCSCEESTQRNQRLIATDRYISESLDHFYEREKLV